MAEKDNTIRDLVLVAAVGGVGIYVARSLMKASQGPAPVVNIPPLPQPPQVMPQQPQQPIIIPMLPGGGGGNQPIIINPSNPNDGGTVTPNPDTPNEENGETPKDPVDLPPPQEIPGGKSDIGNWWARSLNLSGANGGVLQHVEKWNTEYEKRREANPDRPGKLWGMYYRLTSSPAAVKLGGGD